MNNVIKEADRQVSDQASIHEILETRIIKQQESEYIKAIYNTGEYRLSRPYRHHAVAPLDWSTKTHEQKRQHTQKVLKHSDVSYKRDFVATKKLSISVAHSSVRSVPPGLLNQIWKEAEIILSHHAIIDVDDGVYCVTEFGKSTNVSVKSRGSIICKCRYFNSTAGLCHHALAVAEVKDVLGEYLRKFNTKDGKMDKIVFANIPKRAGEKPKEKKKRKGQNNVEQRPVINEVMAKDDDIDFPKPLAFTEIWHNKNDFQVIFTRDNKKAKQCESCKVEFAKGCVICIPQDIAILHMEWYLYPKKDGSGKFLRMEPTWKKETAKFYCAKKQCLICRHPYFWKGLLAINSDTTSRFKEGHLKHLKKMFHLSV